MTKFLMRLFIIIILPLTIFSQVKDERFDPFKNIDGLRWAEETLRSLTLEEKVGQLVIPFTFSYYGSDDSDNFQKLLKYVKEYKVGGFIFSLGDVYECAMLANKLQSESKIPLLISADLERGVAMRINRSTSFPYNMALGASGDETLAYKMGRIIAQEARAIGVHQNYSPVTDLNNNPKNPIINVRSFGEEPNLVSKLSIAFIKGTHSGNVISTIKHFPGHGDTETDSHADLPVLPFDKERLDKLELIPFKKAIDAGAMSVMVAHLHIPKLDPETNVPASLSKKIITGLLIDELKFKGLVVTDGMEMRGITKNFSTAESGIRAILAGNDMVLLPDDPVASVKALIQATKSGRIPMERINESCKKVLALKYWLGLNKNKFVDLNKIASIVGIEQNWQVAKEIAEKSITLLKNEGNLIPFTDKTKKIACITVIDNSETGYGSQFENGFSSKYPRTDIMKIDTRTTSQEFDKIIAKSKNADIILLPVYMKVRAYQGTISFNRQQKIFLDSIYTLGKPIVMISYGNPYLIQEFPKTAVYINAYSDVNLSIDAGLSAVMGENSITGKTPVSIPGMFKVGDGISTQKIALENGSPLDFGLQKNTFDKVDNIVEKAIRDSAFPGASLIIVKNGIIIHKKAYGRFEYDIQSNPMTARTMFDLASVSKVIGTTNAAMKLIGENKLSLDDFVIKYIPEFGVNGKEKITIRNLLLHNSGLPAFKMYYKTCKNSQEVLDSIFASKLIFKTGDSTVYSDFGLITLGKVIEKITGKTLDVYLKEEFFQPLGMYRTMYNPSSELQKESAPTEKDNYWRNKLVQGTVHDENSALLNGVAGHAGLFSTIEDLAKIMQMLMNGGSYGGKTYLSSELIKQFTQRQSEKSTRGLGWDTKNATGYSSSGKLFSKGSFGHTGFTGTSIWADPERNLFVVFLTNRVYPTRENRKISRVREDLHNEIIEDLENSRNKLVY